MQINYLWPHPRGPYTYVIAISVKLRTPSTAVEKVQATTLIKSLFVRNTNK